MKCSIASHYYAVFNILHFLVRIKVYTAHDVIRNFNNIQDNIFLDRGKSIGREGGTRYVKSQQSIFDAPLNK